MNEVVELYQNVEPGLMSGIVTGEIEGTFMVSTDTESMTAGQAFSCLVKPQEGDKVLLATDATRECFILAVLRRPKDSKETDISLDGNVNLHTNNGSLSITSDKDLTIASEDRLSLATGKITVHAEKGAVTLGVLSFIGKSIHSQVKRVKSVANTVENTFLRLTQRLENSFRFINDQEEVQSRSSRYLVEETMTIQAKNAVHIAEENVTINAEQIHLA